MSAPTRDINVERKLMASHLGELIARDMDARHRGDASQSQETRQRWLLLWPIFRALHIETGTEP